MMMNKILLTLLLSSNVAFASCPSGYVLAPDQYHQQQFWWCWNGVNPQSGIPQTENLNKTWLNDPDRGVSFLTVETPDPATGYTWIDHPIYGHVLSSWSIDNNGSPHLTIH
jgi:hypothetical protein